MFEILCSHSFCVVVRPFHLHYWIQALSFFRHSFIYFLGRPSTEITHPNKIKCSVIASEQCTKLPAHIRCLMCVCVCGWVKSMISFKLIKFSNGFHYPVGKSTSNIMPFSNTMNTMTFWTMGFLDFFLLLTASDTLSSFEHFFFRCYSTSSPFDFAIH